MIFLHVVLCIYIGNKLVIMIFLAHSFIDFSAHSPLVKITQQNHDQAALGNPQIDTIDLHFGKTTSTTTKSKYIYLFFMLM